MVTGPNQCTATAKSTGEQCQRAAVKGASVCHVHGGAASQVKEKARERLDRMADETTAKMQDAMRTLFDELQAVENPETKAAIMRELRHEWLAVLDRTGHGPESTQNVESKTLDSIAPAFIDESSGDD